MRSEDFKNTLKLSHLFLLLRKLASARCKDFLVTVKRFGAGDHAFFSEKLKFVLKSLIFAG
jgi:hypothetical protein